MKCEKNLTSRFTFYISHKQGYVKVYKKNRLKDLIYIQDNKPCNEQTIKGLFRSIVEPVLESETQSMTKSLVLCRLEDKSKNEFDAMIKRLEYSNAEVYDFSDERISQCFKYVLGQKIWDKTEFIYVLAERFGAVLIFDYEESDIDGFAGVYTLFNSKDLAEAFDIINANSQIDLGEYSEKSQPDRRDNILLNNSIRKIIENLNETNQEIMISEMTKDVINEDSDVSVKLEFLMAKSNYIAHEMRNLLSICKLYSEIIEKQRDKITYANKDVEKSILNARENIKKAMQMVGNLLLDFKSLNSINLKEYNLEHLITSGLELAQIYANGKDIKFESKGINSRINILADEYKFLSVLINIIKNAVESIDETGKITIKTDADKENVRLVISNDGNPISKDIQNRIFEEGFSTKTTGSGLGLVICKKTLEEQSAQLKLLKSDNVSTEFEITLLKA